MSIRTFSISNNKKQGNWKRRSHIYYETQQSTAGKNMAHHEEHIRNQCIQSTYKNKRKRTGYEATA